MFAYNAEHYIQSIHTSYMAWPSEPWHRLCFIVYPHISHLPKSDLCTPVSHHLLDGGASDVTSMDRPLCVHGRRVFFPYRKRVRFANLMPQSDLSRGRYACDCWRGIDAIDTVHGAGLELQWYMHSASNSLVQAWCKMYVSCTPWYNPMVQLRVTSTQLRLSL